VTTGDHVFVDKVRWNLTKPKRGDIIVFNTDGIATLPPKTHYIKRLVGLPNERIAIDPPRLIVNGQSITSPRGIERIVHTDPGYRGYLLAGRLEAPADSVQLGPTEYFAMGDNTANSRDSRYWGAVPQENMVGPAFLVYWPFSARWGMPR
jgi:signal peptidase I